MRFFINGDLGRGGGSWVDGWMMWDGCLEGRIAREREGEKENPDKQESFQFVESSKDRAGWNLGYEYEYEYSAV